MLRKSPAVWFTLAAWMARCNSKGETWWAAIRSGSMSTCTTRGRPPTTYARDTFFSPARRCVTSSATRRERHVVWQRSLASVSVTMGTSSISTGLTTQPLTPGGTMSTFSSIFL